MDKLTELFKERELLTQLLTKNEKDIKNEQIVREDFLIEQLGFRKISEKNNILTFRKYTRGTEYQLILNLTFPKQVMLQRVNQDTIHTFQVNEIEEFVDLLVFLNIL